MPSLMEKLHAKMELFRLEQRYTRNRHRRSTFISNAVYVDGEYVYQTPHTTGGSTASSSASSSPATSPMSTDRRMSSCFDEPHHRPAIQEEDEQREEEDKPQPPAAMAMPPRQQKRLSRFASMPGFGGSSSKKDAPEWTPGMIDVRQAQRGGR